MSIQFIKMDVTTAEGGIVAQGVNCQGVMGSGVAKAIRDKWPKVFTTYKQYVDTHVAYGLSRGELLGEVQVADVGDTPGQLYVANCFTQEFYGRDGRVYASLSAVGESLSFLMGFSVGLNLPLLMPRIGCGLGGLNWDNEVGPLLELIHRAAIDQNLGEPQIYVCDL